jgi:Mor family transcriptional regulator
MQSKNTVYARRWFKQNFILIAYENKGYDMKVYPKLVLNKMKVMGGPTPIYTPLGTSLKEASIEASMYAPTKEALWKTS